MNQIKVLFKDILVLIVNSMIVFTFMMTPLSGSIQNVYAQGNDEKEECEKEEQNADGSPGVYKPGCNFDDALTDIDESPEESGIKGLVEQFVGIAFASAAVSSLIFKHTPRSIADCSQNKNANITLRLMQAGALAYLLGEMKAKAEFSKASKLATDSTFVPKQKLAENASDNTINERNRVENNKQLEAYETLIKVYEYKVKGIEAKKNLALVAELAYLGALGTELVMTLGHKAQCRAASSAFSSLERTINLGIKLNLKAAAASTVVNPACASAVTALTTLEGVEISTAAQRKIEGRVLSVQAEVGDSLDTTLMNGVFIGLPTVLSTGKAIEVTNKTAEENEASDNVSATKSDRSEQGREAQETPVWKAAVSTCKACSSCGGINGTRNSEVNADRMPIQCCGLDTKDLSSGTGAIPPKSVMDKKIDIFIKKIPIIGTNQIEFIKPAILNTIEQFYYAKIMGELDPKSPDITLSKLKSFYTYLEQLEQSFDDEIKHSIEFKKYKQELAGEFNEEKTLASFEKLKFSLIQDAHAVNFMSILGFGAKLFLMNKLLGKFLRNKGLVKPKNRMYTFGAMGAVNAAIVLFEGKKLSENKKHLEIVKSEKERFEKSHALQTGLLVESGTDEGLIRIGEGEGENYLRLTRNQGVTACAKPAAGNSFAPAPCPQVLPTKFLRELNTSSSRGRTQVTPLLQQIPALVATTTAAAASGDDLNNPEVFGANLAALESNRAALKSQVDKLVKDFDETDKASKDSKGKRADPLARTLANIQKTFKGTPVGGSAPTLGSLSDTKNIEEASDASKKAEKTSSSNIASNPAPAIKSPTSASGSSGFDFGDQDGFGTQPTSSGASKPQSLDEFVVNTGEVADKPEANIFKLISNRYLRSYPILLEEVELKTAPTE